MVSVERALQIAQITVYAALWGVTVAITVFLTIDWLDSGSAEKVSLESTPLTQVDPPWIVLLSYMSCPLEVSLSEFWTAPYPVGVPWYMADARQVVQTLYSGDNFQAILISQMMALELGLKFRAEWDNLLVGLTVTNDSLDNCQNLDDYAAGLRLFMIPVSGENVSYRLLHHMDLDYMGNWISVGLGSMVSVVFSLKQEVYSNGTTRNSTHFSVSQHPILRPGDKMFSRDVLFEISTSDFHIQRTVHRPGAQILELLADVFGWAGVFSGMCLLTVWGWIADLVRRICGDERASGMGPPRDSVEMDSEGKTQQSEGDGCSGCQALSAELTDLRRRTLALGDRLAHLEAAAPCAPHADWVTCGATSSSASSSSTGLGPAPASRTPKDSAQLTEVAHMQPVVGPAEHEAASRGAEQVTAPRASGPAAAAAVGSASTTDAISDPVLPGRQQQDGRAGRPRIQSSSRRPASTLELQLLSGSRGSAPPQRVLPPRPRCGAPASSGGLPAPQLGPSAPGPHLQGGGGPRTETLATPQLPPAPPGQPLNRASPPSPPPQSPSRSAISRTQQGGGGPRGASSYTS